MAERVLFPEWRKQNATTNYPFAMEATLGNGAQALTQGLLVDAVLYPVGGGAQMRLSQVDVTYDQLTLWIGDNDNAQLAGGTVSLPAPGSSVALLDAYNRPAGLLIANPVQLSLLSTWGAGSFLFSAAQTEFAAACCVPTPQTGVRGILLEDGSLFTGDVWLAGAGGVVLSLEEMTVPGAACQESDSLVMAVRVDVVGDPLFQRSLCQPLSLFQTPRFVKTITFSDASRSVIATPDENGDVKLTVNNALAADTVLRIHPTPAGTMIDAAGSSIV